MDPIALPLIMLFASFTQGVAGFGLALVAMPLIIESLGVQSATSLIALIAIIARIALLINYRQAVNLRVAGRLIVASTIALPIGVLGLQQLDGPFLRTLLGILICLYAIYALLNLRLPPVAHPWWAYGAGFFCGLLSGAYNTGGPPVVMYGTSRQWSPAEFKGNIQTVGLLNSLVVIGLHIAVQDYTADVMHDFVLVLPASVVGLALGMAVARYINQALFRRLVLILLLIVGANLII
jgi:hypothetical protein